MPEEGEACRQILCANTGKSGTHLLVGLEDAIGGNLCRFSCARLQSIHFEQQVTAGDNQCRELWIVDQVLDEEGFFGQTAQFAAASAAAVQFAQVIVGVDEPESSGVGRCPGK